MQLFFEFVPLFNYGLYLSFCLYHDTALVLPFYLINLNYLMNLSVVAVVVIRKLKKF